MAGPATASISSQFDDIAPSGAPIASVVQAIAAEVGELAKSADSLQHLVGGFLCDPFAMVTPEQLEQGQVLDALVQRLQALETFLDALGPVIETSWRVDPRAAADLVLLSRVAQRLSGSGVETVQPVVGDCDFF